MGEGKDATPRGVSSIWSGLAAWVAARVEVIAHLPSLFRIRTHTSNRLEYRWPLAAHTLWICYNQHVRAGVDASFHVPPVAADLHGSPTNDGEQLA